MPGRRLAIPLVHLLGVGAVCWVGTTPTLAVPATSAAAATIAPIGLRVLTADATQPAGAQGQFMGIVSSVSGTCPELTFVVSGVTIHLSRKTRFESGACSDVKEGMRAGAIGAKRADGSVDAERAIVGTPQPAPVTGLIKSLSGSCPSLTFFLDNVAVRTSGKTVFDSSACSDLKDGVRAGALGPRAADGSVQAERVRIAPAPLPAVTGTVSSVAGACPTLTFVIDRTTIHVSAKTQFEGSACTAVKVGVTAGAMGPKRSDGSIDAERVKVRVR